MSRLSPIVAAALLVSTVSAVSMPTMTYPFKVQGTTSSQASGQLLVRTLSPASSLSVLTVRGLTPNTPYVAHYHSLGTASSDPCASNGPISLVFPPFKTNAQGEAIALLRAVPARISGTAGAYVNVHTAADVGVIPLCAAVLKAGTDAPTTNRLNDHRLKPEGLKAQGSGLKVRLQTPYAPKNSCQLCALFKFKDQPQDRAES